MRSGPGIEVPMVLREDQIQAYLRDGYVVVPGLASREDRDRLCADIVEFARGAYPVRNPPSVSPGASEEEILRSILAIHFPHRVSPVMRSVVGHPRICGALAQITGAHLPWWDGSVKCVQSMAFVKAPGMPGQAWHQDERHIPTRDRSLVGAWIALDDATVDTGCLWAIPGSHRDGYLHPTRPHDRHDEFDPSDEAHGFDESAKRPLECAAGSVVFFNGYLLHRSMKNRGTGFRRVVVNHYCNAWSLLPWYLKDGEQVATADRRTIVPVAGVDPYAWKGFEDPPGGVFLRPHRPDDDGARDGSATK